MSTHALGYIVQVPEILALLFDIRFILYLFPLGAYVVRLVSGETGRDSSFFVRFWQNLVSAGRGASATASGFVTDENRFFRSGRVSTTFFRAQHPLRPSSLLPSLLSYSLRRHLAPSRRAFSPLLDGISRRRRFVVISDRNSVEPVDGHRFASYFGPLDESR